MHYEMPVKVYEEENCILNHSGQLASLGKRALIVTGRHSARANGSLRDVTEALEKEGVEYAVFDEIEENPSVETVMRGKRARTGGAGGFRHRNRRRIASGRGEGDRFYDAPSGQGRFVSV